MNRNNRPGADNWTTDLVEKAFKDAGLSAKEHYEQYGKDEGITGFASGGYHAGGLRIVGERGPELEATGSSQIYNNNDLAGILKNGDGTKAEIIELRKDVNVLLKNVAKNTKETSKQLEKWDGDGLPEARGY